MFYVRSVLIIMNCRTRLGHEDSGVTQMQKIGVFPITQGFIHIELTEMQSIPCDLVFEFFQDYGYRYNFMNTVDTFSRLPIVELSRLIKIGLFKLS